MYVEEVANHQECRPAWQIFRPQGLALGLGSETSPTQLSDGLGLDSVNHSSRPEITGYDGMVCSLRNALDNYRRLGLKTLFRLVVVSVSKYNFAQNLSRLCTSAPSLNSWFWRRRVVKLIPARGNSLFHYCIRKLRSGWQRQTFSRIREAHFSGNHSESWYGYCLCLADG